MHALFDSLYIAGEFGSFVEILIECLLQQNSNQHFNSFTVQMIVAILQKLSLKWEQKNNELTLLNDFYKTKFEQVLHSQEDDRDGDSRMVGEISGEFRRQCRRWQMESSLLAVRPRILNSLVHEPLPAQVGEAKVFPNGKTGAANADAAIVIKQ